MKGKVSWVEGGRFLAESGSGHAAPMHAKILGDDGSTAPSPMEYVLLGTGGCSCVDVVHILSKGRADVRDCVVLMDAERATEEPKVFTRIHMHFVVRGRGLKKNLVEHAIRLSHEKYCSASIMLGTLAEITYDFKVVDVTAEAAVPA
jgi:putative redox protein